MEDASKIKDLGIIPRCSTLNIPSDKVDKIEIAHGHSNKSTISTASSNDKIPDEQKSSTTSLENTEANMKKLNLVLKALCVNCKEDYNNDCFGNSCNYCGKILCEDCNKICGCFKCGKKMCPTHCVKCHLCNKRACKSKACISEFRICQICEYTFCQEHFEPHKNFNNQEEYGIKCITKKCKTNFKIANRVEEFLTSIVNACYIRELKLRK